MATQKRPEQAPLKWLEATEPKPEIYSNFVHVSWTLFDLRVLFGQLVPSEPGEAKTFVVEQQGAVTMAWPQAKNLRDMLSGLVDSYEKTNGEIKQLKIPPVPTPPAGTNPSEE